MQRQKGVFILGLLAAAFVFVAWPAFAQDISATIDLSYDYGRVIDDSAGTDVTTNEIKQKYQLEVKAPLTLKFEFETKAVVEVDTKLETEKPTENRITPSLETLVKSEEMEGKVGLKYIYDTFSATEAEEETTKKQWDNYVEYKLKEDRFPDLSAKYSYKSDYELGAADKVDRVLDATLDHDISDLKIKLQYVLTEGEDWLPDAEDKTTVESKAEASWKRKIIDDLFDVELSYKYSDKQEETFLDSGERVELVATTTQEAEGKLKGTLEPLPQTKVEPEFDYKIIMDEVEESDEVTQDAKLAITQGLLQWVELKASGEYKTTEKIDTPAEDSLKTEQIYTGEMKGTYDWWLDLNGKYEWKDTREEFEDVTKEETIDRSITWEANWKAKWADLLEPSVSVTRKDEYENENLVLVTSEDKAKATFNVSFGSILKLEPVYEYTFTEDYDVDTAALTSETTINDIKVKVTVDYDLSDYANLKFSHQYGHKNETTEATGEPTDEVTTIEEDTKATLEAHDLWPGFKAIAEFTRDASDESDDDEGMKVDLTYSFKVDGAFNRWKYNGTLNYDNKGGGDADDWSMELKVDWEYEEFKLGGSYKFTHTFATEEDLEKDEHDATVTLTYTF